MKPNSILLPVLFSLALTGCSFGAPAAAPTATITSEDVLATAQAIADATRQALAPTSTRPPASPTPTEVLATSTPPATATPDSPLLTADYNANVRSGPDEDYAIIDFMLQGDQANALGRYISEETGTWYYFTRIGEGRDGWIWGGAVTVAGDVNLVPVIEPPPEPTEGPSPTPFS